MFFKSVIGIDIPTKKAILVGTVLSKQIKYLITNNFFSIFVLSKHSWMLSAIKADINAKVLINIYFTDNITKGSNYYLGSNFTRQYSVM